MNEFAFSQNVCYTLVKFNSLLFYDVSASILQRIFNSINKASKGIRFKRQRATNGGAVGTIWTVFLI